MFDRGGLISARQHFFATPAWQSWAEEGWTRLDQAVLECFLNCPEAEAAATLETV